MVDYRPIMTLDELIAMLRSGKLRRALVVLCETPEQVDAIRESLAEFNTHEMSEMTGELTITGERFGKPTTERYPAMPLVTACALNLIDNVEDNVFVSTIEEKNRLPNYISCRVIHVCLTEI